MYPKIEGRRAISHNTRGAVIKADVGRTKNVTMVRMMYVRDVLALKY